MYDLIWSITLVPVLLLIGAALVSLFRRAPQLPLASSLRWFFIILLLPVFGALLWFIFRATNDSDVRSEQL